MRCEWLTANRSARLHDAKRLKPSDRFVAAVSLHAHTRHSHEVMSTVPAVLDRIPIVAGLFRREMDKYEERHGEHPDFSKGWWHPPLSAAAVVHSEVTHIAACLGLRAIVSITDHDSIDAGLSLHRSQPSTPLSFEWTVPYHEGFFHLGVHNLAPASARSIHERLLTHTRREASPRLAELLDEVNADPGTLVVLNHPLWDLACVGPTRHATLLRRFLTEYGGWLHGLEANGYRSQAENASVATLAERSSLALISGGDRHGCEPNSLLNLTSATTFAAFAAEVRGTRCSDIVEMPHYQQRLFTRKLAVAADVLRASPQNPPGDQTWTDRVSCERHGSVNPLSRYWPTGGPFWVRSTIRGFQLLTSRPVLPTFALLMSLGVGSGGSGPDPTAFGELLNGIAPPIAVKGTR